MKGFAQVQSVIEGIMALARQGDVCKIEALAETGLYLAGDAHNLADTQRENYLEWEAKMFDCKAERSAAFGTAISSGKLEGGPSNADKAPSEVPINALDEANHGFFDLRALAVGIASLVRNSEHGERNDDLATATSLLYQLEEKAMVLAEAMDQAQRSPS
jgi:hypothetical protein